MFKWKLVYHMTNGEKHTALYIGPENNSDNVLMKLFNNRQDGDLVTTFNKDKSGVIAVKYGEIQVIEVSEYKGE